jgi:hypothetical protein
MRLTVGGMTDEREGFFAPVRGSLATNPAPASTDGTCSRSDQIRQVAADSAVVLLIRHDDDLTALAADRQLTLTPPRKAIA